MAKKPKVIRTQWSTAFILQALETLFKPHKQAIQNDADRFIIDSIRYLPPGCKAIHYAGSRWAHSTTPPGKRTFYQAPPEMKDKFEYLQEKERLLDIDYQECKQVLVMTLKPHGSSLQDFRNNVPECILDCFPDQVKQYPRTEEPYEISPDFTKGMELLEYYSAARLLI